MNQLKSSYLNTDFDLRSESPFGTLHKELSSQCLVLHYQQCDDGHYSACYESDHDGEMQITGAERDILLLTQTVRSLSPTARSEFEACYLRELNLGFDVGDTWAFSYSVPPDAVAAAADVKCSLAVTLYPMRHPDGTRRG